MKTILHIISQFLIALCLLNGSVCRSKVVISSEVMVFSLFVMFHKWRKDGLWISNSWSSLEVKRSMFKVVWYLSRREIYHKTRTKWYKVQVCNDGHILHCSLGTNIVFILFLTSRMPLQSFLNGVQLIFISGVCSSEQWWFGHWLISMQVRFVNFSAT